MMSEYNTAVLMSGVAVQIIHDFQKWATKIHGSGSSKNESLFMILHESSHDYSTSF